jgi:hypothetical protein
MAPARKIEGLIRIVETGGCACVLQPIPIPSFFGFRTVAPSAAAQDAQEPHEPPRHPGPKADAQQSGAPGLTQGQAQPKFPEAVRGQVPGTMTARL